MSDINTPDKIEGDTFSPAEYNAFKAAINTKQDKNKLKTTLGSPNNTDYPTTKAVTDYISQYIDVDCVMQCQDTIDGTEDLNAEGICHFPGFYMPCSDFTNTPHASYPTGSTKGCLITFQHEDQVVQRYIQFAPTTDDYAKEWIRTYDADSEVWGKWTGQLRNTDIRTDLLDPSNSSVPTTKAVTDLTDGGVTYRGEIDGSENLDLKSEAGYWMPTTGFGGGGVHSSYPVEDVGMLIVYANNNFVLQKFCLLLSQYVEYTRTFTGSGWTEWTAIQEGSTPPAPGTPAVDTTGSGYSATLVAGSNDLEGQITVTHDSGDNLTSFSVRLMPSAAWTNVKSAQITPGNANASTNGWWINSLSGTTLSFQIGGAIPAGQSSIFHYSIQKS